MSLGEVLGMSLGGSKEQVYNPQNQEVVLNQKMIFLEIMNVSFEISTNTVI